MTRVARTAPSKPGLMLLPGWNEDPVRSSEDLRLFAGMGLACASLAFPEAQSAAPGRDTLRHNLAAVLKRYDELAARPGVDRGAVAVVGTSYGGYLGAILTTFRRVDWLVLRAPAIYADEDWDTPKEMLDKADMARYRQLPLNPSDNKALTAAARFSGDVLIVASECDDVVPEPVVSNFLSAFGSSRTVSHRILPGADHALSKMRWRKAYHRLARTWLQDAMASQAPRKPAA
jgi:dipeptidyl aminopeptidase/acylaminoacyl peptidase